MAKLKQDINSFLNHRLNRHILRYIQYLVLFWPSSDTTVLGWVSRFANRDSALFALRNMGKAMQFHGREQLWSYVMQKRDLGDSQTLLEFGVWKGASLKYFADIDPNMTLYGFDSFKGLSEDWEGFSLPRGTFNLEGHPDTSFPKNVQLVIGEFQDTLPSFIRSLTTSISVIHIDCDTYSSTLFVLEQIFPMLSPKTLIIFDDFFGYPGWRKHGYRALQEFTIRYSLKITYLAYSNRQIAVSLSRLLELE